MNESQRQQFVKNIEVNENQCWLWNTTKSESGYGVFEFEGKICLAHEYAYLTIKGKDITDMEIQHKCNIKHCCNPDHIYLSSKYK